MLLNQLTKWLPDRLLSRLTLINIVVVSSFIVISGWFIYDTACALNGQKQHEFDSTLFNYLWIFSITAIVIGSFIHYYLVKKLTRPLKDLTDSTKSMKEGQYPQPIEGDSKDEMGQLIGHFNDLILELKTSEQQRKETVVNLSHEIRTPLSNLNGYLSALKNGVVEGNEQVYGALHEEAKHLTQLIDQLEQLKEWDQINHQTYTDKKPMNMYQLIEQSTQMFHWSLQDANIPLKIDAEHGMVNVYHGGIEQVISNLLDNAIKYHKGNGSIHIQGIKLQNIYQFSMTGPGQTIPDEERKHVFDRLYRADPSRTKSQTSGNGLGLAISKEIIEHHQGEIGVTSDGNEHTFWFTLLLD